MITNIDEFKKLVDAEEFFIFFNLPYDQKFVNVNRLHILKKFSQTLKNSSRINKQDGWSFVFKSNFNC